MKSVLSVCNYMSGESILSCSPVNSVSTSPTASAQVIRLVGGSASNEGRVQVFRSGEWQTVCDNAWDLNEANVACRQLGYGYAIKVVTQTLFGRGTGEQWGAYFHCRGNESRLDNCFTASSSCSHSEDVGVICSTSSEYRIQYQYYSCIIVMIATDVELDTRFFPGSLHWHFVLKMLNMNGTLYSLSDILRMC